MNNKARFYNKRWAGVKSGPPRNLYWQDTDQN